MRKKFGIAHYFWILLFAVLVMSLLYSIEKPWQSTAYHNDSQSPDWYMINVQAKSYSDQGYLKGTIQSPKVTHYVKNNVIQITKPFANLYDSSGNTWVIQALTGQAFQDKPQHIFLQNQVNIKELPSKTSNNLLIQTDHLTYYVDTQTAKTDAPITVTQPGNILHAVGADANFETGDIKFLANVQMEYNNANQQTKKP